MIWLFLGLLESYQNTVSNDVKRLSMCCSTAGQYLTAKPHNFEMSLAINSLPVPGVKCLKNIFSTYSFHICYIITYICVPNKHWLNTELCHYCQFNLCI